MTATEGGLFRVRLTADFYDADGKPRYRDIGLSLLEREQRILTERFAEHRAEIGADQVGNAHGVIVLTPSVTAASVAGCANLLTITRFGVGYDTVDVGACTEADVAVCITAGAVDRPVAEATVGWMIALSHQMLAKDRLLRRGEWDERTKYMGTELRERTFGAVGLGGIARMTIGLLRGFGMNQPIACDPYVTAEAAEGVGVRLVGLEELMREADFVSIHCPLNEKTRELIGARELGLMKETAYLINTARGGIVEEGALFAALKERRIAGAALDCFVGEPIREPHRFGKLDNVMLAPHAIAWTHELFRDIGRMACRTMLDLASGKRPAGVINPEVFESPGFQEKWKRVRGG